MGLGVRSFGCSFFLVSFFLHGEWFRVSFLLMPPACFFWLGVRVFWLRPPCSRTSFGLPVGSALGFAFGFSLPPCPLRLALPCLLPCPLGLALPCLPACPLRLALPCPPACLPGACASRSPAPLPPCAAAAACRRPAASLPACCLRLALPCPPPSLRCRRRLPPPCRLPAAALPPQEARTKGKNIYFFSRAGFDCHAAG